MKKPVQSGDTSFCRFVRAKTTSAQWNFVPGVLNLFVCHLVSCHIRNMALFQGVPRDYRGGWRRHRERLPWVREYHHGRPGGQKEEASDVRTGFFADVLAWCLDAWASIAVFLSPVIRVFNIFIQLCGHPVINDHTQRYIISFIRAFVRSVIQYLIHYNIVLSV